MPKIKRRFISIFVLLVIAAAAFLFGWSSIFTVKSIAIIGVDQSEERVINNRINIKPEVIKIGIPLARVEKRVVASRLLEIPWIKSASVKRNWISQSIQITISKRVPIAVITNSNGRTFIDEEMQLFILPASNQLISDLSKLPKLTLMDSSQKSLLAFDQLRQKIGEINSIDINAKSIQVQSFVVNSAAWSITELVIDGRNLKVTWGDNQDLSLKIKVFRELLQLPENAKIVRMDLTSPLSPIVK